MYYVGISTYQFILYYASAINKHSHAHILKPFEDSETTGLKVDIATCTHTHKHAPVWVSVQLQATVCPSLNDSF